MERNRARRSLALVTALALTVPAVMATGGAVAAQDGAKFCEGTDIVFFPGGSPGGAFAQVVHNGAVAAADLLGANMATSWTDWDISKMITQFGEAVATDPDGIAVMGHPGDVAFKDLIDSAVADGIVVTVMNTELPETQSAHAAEGTGYVGQVLYVAGWDLAKETIKRGELNPGDKVFVWGLLAEPGRGERTRGIIEGLVDSGWTEGEDIIYLEMTTEINGDPSLGIPIYTGIAEANPELKAVIFDHGEMTATAQTYLETAGQGPEDVYVSGFDLAVPTVEAVRSGYTDLVIDQQQWLQGFEAVLQICLTHNYQFAGLRINTGGGFMDASNVDALAELVEQQNSLMTSERVASGGATAGEGSGPRQSDADRCLELRGVYKHFGGVRVLEDIDFHLDRGEVVGLLGDNGAGKSTLIKIITGVHQPDRGEIRFSGEAVHDLTVQRARALGVETVFQERALADQQPLWRNIFIGRPITTHFGLLDVGEMRRITEKLMTERMGFTSAVLTPDTTVTGLSGGERQGLAIVRALYFDADIIILDEPTMGLSLKETEKLLHFVEGIREQHKSAIFIDHNIFHVYSVADRIVLIDRGRIAGDFPTSRYTLEELMDIMREVASTGQFEPDRSQLPNGDGPDV